MTAITPAIKLFTGAAGSTAGIQINSLVLEHRGNNYHLQGGTKVTIHAFAQSIALYVLTINKRQGYMGLNAYMGSEPDPISMFFMHTPGDIVEHLGDEWEELAPREIVEKLMDYLV